MTLRPTAKLLAYLWICAVGVIVGAIAGRPALAGIALPFGLYAAAGLAFARAPVLRLRVWTSTERLMEGDDVVLSVAVRAEALVAFALLEPRVPLGMSGGAMRAVRLPALERTMTFILHAPVWGSYDVGPIDVRASDACGLLEWTGHTTDAAPVRVLPSRLALRTLPPPSRLYAQAGGWVSRARGAGIEFAELRPFQSGDAARDVDWRVTARRGALHVRQHYNERAATVVLFLDAFVGGSVIQRSIRVVAVLADRYLGNRDRVGLVVFGGTVSWVTPAAGALQRLHILDALLKTQVTFSYASKSVRHLPRGALPAACLVLAVSPLLDRRGQSALLDLRARGFDVAVVEVEPEPPAPASSDRAEELAQRIWLLERDAIRRRYRRAGIAVATSGEGSPLELAAQEVAEFRRAGRS